MVQKKKTRKRKSTKSKGNVFSKFREQVVQIIKSEKTRKTLGILCCLASLFLCIAFISYIFSTWGADQSYVKDISLKDVFYDDEVRTRNLSGRLGSYLSHRLIYQGFGLAAFTFVIVLLLIGLKLFKPSRYRYAKSRMLMYAFLSLMLLSPILSFLSYGASYSFPFGGSFGNYVTNWLIGFMGMLMTAVTLMALLTLVFMYLIDINAYWVQFKNSRLVNTLVNWFSPSTSNVRHRPQTSTVGSNLSNGRFQREDKAFEKGKQVELDFKQKPPPKAAPAAKKKTREELEEELKLKVVSADERNRSLTDIEKEDAVLALGEEYDPTLDLSDYVKPHLDLLESYGRDLYHEDTLGVNREELERNKEQIVQTLNNYNIAIADIKATPGPTITLYEIIPAPGVRISKIRNLEDDIALSLAALGIRIIAPMPGKGTIGIEVPNQNKEIVSLRSLLTSEKFKNTKMDLPIAFGKTIADENFIADLSKMPHLLLAGATGQGKSVCLNSILVSLLYRKHPAELKFVMIDPKKVELALYEYIEKHFLAKLPNAEEAIVTDIKKVIHTLNALCIEMDMRYDLLKRAYVRNVREYNRKFTQRKLNPEKGHRFLPYIVLVIDEFADLIMTAGKEVELPLARLAQLARAIGIHLVIATQRPTVNIITGTIKANFPVRIAFRVTSKVDSRTIIDMGGANQLIGKGDMLLSIGGDLIRLQGAFVDTPEVERVADFISQQRSYPEPYLLPEYRDDDDKTQAKPGEIAFDDLFDEAAHIIVQHQQGSTSLLQRRLKLGYNRAGRIMDQLEAVGIVGPNIGSKAREVYILDAMELETFLEHLKNKDK